MWKSLYKQYLKGLYGLVKTFDFPYICKNVDFDNLKENLPLIMSTEIEEIIPVVPVEAP